MFLKIKEIRGMRGRVNDGKVQRGVVGSAPTYAKRGLVSTWANAARVGRQVLDSVVANPLAQRPRYKRTRRVSFERDRPHRALPLLGQYPERIILTLFNRNGGKKVAIRLLFYNAVDTWKKIETSKR